MTEEFVEIADRATTVTRLVDALSAIKTGRGDETMGLPAPMRRAAAEGFVDLGFRYIEAVATHRVVMPKNTPLGPHAAAGVAEIDDETMQAALDAFNPELAAKYRAAATDEERAALRESLRPAVESTLQRSLDLDEATSAVRAQGKRVAAEERERRDARERGE